MKLKEYSLAVGETINTGNFSSFKYEVSGTVLLNGENDAADIDELKEFLKSKAREIRKQAKGE